MRFRSSTARHPGHRVDGATSALGDHRLQDDHSRCCWPAARSRRDGCRLRWPSGRRARDYGLRMGCHGSTAKHRHSDLGDRTPEQSKPTGAGRLLCGCGSSCAVGTCACARCEAWAASCDGDDRGLARRRPASHASHDCSVRRSILPMLRQSGLRTLSVRAACSWLRCRGARFWVLARSRFIGVGRFRAWSRCVIV